MTTGHVFIATSLDGFVARKDHQLDWLMKYEVDPENTDFADFMESVDGLVMGSGSFRTVVGFGQWPYAKPVVVMSRSMTDADIPDDLRDKVRVMSGSPTEVMEALGADGWSRAYVDGGNLVQSFMRDGLISDLTITLIPTLIGEGISLFGSLDADIDLELVSADTMKNGMLKTMYRVK